MFSKHVWYDNKHQAEVFISDEGVVSGTIVAYEGAVFLINPRPEILTALYQEAKLKRILAVKGVIMTDNTIAYTRGLCALVNYSRGLRRKTPLVVVTREDTTIPTDFLSSCCSRLLAESSLFEFTIERLKTGESYPMGKGSIRFVRPPRGNTTSAPYLVVRTDKDRTLHYYDESHEGAFDSTHVVKSAKPNVVIRAAELQARAKMLAE